MMGKIVSNKNYNHYNFKIGSDVNVPLYFKKKYPSNVKLVPKIKNYVNAQTSEDQVLPLYKNGVVYTGSFGTDVQETLTDIKTIVNPVTPITSNVIYKKLVVEVKNEGGELIDTVVLGYISTNDVLEVRKVFQYKKYVSSGHLKMVIDTEDLSKFEISITLTQSLTGESVVKKWTPTDTVIKFETKYTGKGEITDNDITVQINIIKKNGYDEPCKLVIKNFIFGIN